MTFDFQIEETRDNFDALAAEVYNERCRQRGKWGPQKHDLDHWLVILGEEYGEACEWALEARAAVRALNLGSIPPGKLTDAERAQYEYDAAAGVQQIRAELIQVAAVAMAIASGLPAASEEDACPTSS
ncbi:MAG: hypothetical protein PVH29_06125 [Candidatus Zixiibacteriota bacterium]|jgi:hypothetical protein